jgi:hypothetical protein
MTFGGSGAIGSQIGDLQQSDAERLVGHRRLTLALTSSTPPTPTRGVCRSRSPARR